MFKTDKMGVYGAWFAHRWMADFGFFSLRLHHWFGSDDPDAMHDHPGWFATLVLWGGYDDKHMTQDGWEIDRLRIGSARFRSADYRHTVINRHANTWTLCLFGKPVHRWQFFSLRTGRRMKRDKYFAEVGHHTATGERIRIKPSGERIASSITPLSKAHGG